MTRVKELPKVSEDQPIPRRALITGGACGFGLATAKALLEQGAYVAIGDINTEALDKVTRLLSSPKVLALELDVTSRASVEQAVNACRKRFGGLDTLINSAGVIHFGPLEEVTEQDWDHVIAVDLKGVFLCCQAAVPLLRQSGRRGRIVNLGSDASRMGWPADHFVLCSQVWCRWADQVSGR